MPENVLFPNIVFFFFSSYKIICLNGTSGVDVYVEIRTGHVTSRIYIFSFCWKGLFSTYFLKHGSFQNKV